ncbi:GNAT family N-acetyltransferase [Aliiroseovarius crassostreae]|uniref:GNAT family N-acetyltransferase n=1 Tax=Aliiroseovarius crassostreae TaxID=154981 RepID=A0A9Q9LSW4_9RHOB|nr:GNAT family N-acetyltransferase [Aliiroseovarius crassostreae]UWP94545.1 GNAT family N-acetyltransferase [Aliiroseovarius crassostreae]UWP97687.1 GNAT family N-acetyltransferase [Aliiroseovarius crassostreae]UWQ07139.1 GNAT family N-acetyltransferase [Aliiroseovarius crassostreae]UWQ10248.1 GNAT family N-acetyltransferase [Aliiroseovarius crassostreae]
MTSAGIDVRPLTGADLEDHLADVARLRMQVFRDWPYLYDGTFEYEHRYLQSYRKSEGAVLVGAFEDDRLVGAATGTPMEDHADDFAAAFAKSGYELGDIFYHAESVLLPSFRGRGIGHRFFDIREAHARTLGRRYAAFCSVIRPLDHPARPANYRPLDEFWRKRGYEKIDGVLASFSWKDVGKVKEDVKQLQFWIRAL